MASVADLATNRVLAARARLSAARARFARAERCLDIARDALLCGNHAAFGLRDAADQERGDALRDIRVARAHLRLAVVRSCGHRRVAAARRVLDRAHAELRAINLTWPCRPLR